MLRAIGNNRHVTSRWEQSDAVRGDEYDERFRRLAQAGHDIHGEASFVMGYGPSSVLDAGCGTGRVAVELSRRGLDVVGVDLDRRMLEVACEKDEQVEWFLADLASLQLTDAGGEIRRFDAVIAAGNVMIFLAPGSESATVGRLADHLNPGGLLVAGFQLVAGGYDVAAYDADCARAGLELVERYASWSRDPWSMSSGYAVSVHALPAAPDAADPDEEPIALNVD